MLGSFPSLPISFQCVVVKYEDNLIFTLSLAGNPIDTVSTRGNIHCQGTSLHVKFKDLT
jgi:hypothetical protein